MPLSRHPAPVLRRALCTGVALALSLVALAGAREFPAANREGEDHARCRHTEMLRSGTPLPPPPAGAIDYDRIWRGAVLLPECPGHVIRSLSLTGRLHFDYTNLAGDDDDGRYRDWEVRRSRAGFRLGLFEDWELKAEVDFDLNEADPLYLRLTDAYLRWKPNDKLSVKIGKQATFFTLEGSTSSNQLLTVDRSSMALSLWFPQSLIPGVSVEYEDGPWRYSAALHSGGSASPEFGNFDGSGFGLLKIARDFSETLGADEALLGLHYVYQDPDPRNTFTARNQQVGSLNFRYRSGRWGFQSDLAASEGAFDQPDLFGGLLMPYYNINDEWQIVGRAAYIEGDDAGGVRLPFHEREVSPEPGDRCREFYLGVNRYVYGHKFKWQAGVQHTAMSGGGDYEGWGFSTGVRISWW